MSEDQVLMRALRDFDTPTKMPTQDIPIFLRLINDLFPGLTVESKVDEGLKAKIVRVAKERGLQYDEVFLRLINDLFPGLTVESKVDGADSPARAAIVAATVFGRRRGARRAPGPDVRGGALRTDLPPPRKSFAWQRSEAYSMTRCS